MQNYFELLGLPIVFDLDMGALQQAYVHAQQRCHPDRMVGKSDAQRAQAMQITVDVNQAYAALKHPRTRSEHLLALQGVTVNQDSKDSVRPSQTLLMEVMEWNERAADKDASIADELRGEIIANEAVLSELFAEQYYDKAAQATIRQRYLEKALEQVEG